MKGLVTVETFVVQRSQSSAASMGYTTLENTLNKKKAMCTCSARRGGRDWGGGLGGLGTPHMKGLRMRVGNFELNT